MIDGQIAALVREAIEEARGAGALDVAETPETIDVVRPRVPEHGDWSTNVAMRLAKAAGRAPLLVAETIVSHLPARDWLLSAEAVKPGFVNFRVADTWLHDTVHRILEQGPRYGAPDIGDGTPVNVEFVSINPTGPLHVGSARNAVLGDAIARLLEFGGYKVTREYYFNDAGSQMDNFGLSVAARYLELLGRAAEIPEDGYFGDYVVELARVILDQDGDTHADLPIETLGSFMRERAYPIVIRWIEQSLERFRCHMDVWFKERELYESGKVQETLDRLAQLGYVYEEGGAQKLRTKAFGDERDRVVVRSFGAREPTYLLPDLAYHIDKSERGFELMIVVLGADHHAHGPSLRAGMEALGMAPERIEVLIYQWVHVLRGGVPLPMSKRAGTFVTLDELIEEVGPDAARYHLLHSSADNTLYFDIEEVKKQSDENPVYYVQYGHARIASIFARASDRGVRLAGNADLTLLTHPAEAEVMKVLAAFPETVELALRNRAPYRLTRYAENLARTFHAFYTECVVLGDDAPLTQTRLALCAAAKQVVATALGLLGVTAPERMDRDE